MTPYFRLATPADAPALDALMHASNGYDAPDMRAMIESVRVDLTPRDGYVGYLIEDAQGIGGFYTLMRLSAETWELDLMFAANDRQGLGYGRELFAHAAAEARARGASILAITSNPQAAQFYLRMGARLVGTAEPEGRMTWPRPKLELTL